MTSGALCIAGLCIPRLGLCNGGIQDGDLIGAGGCKGGLEAGAGASRACSQAPERAACLHCQLDPHRFWVHRRRLEGSPLQQRPAMRQQPDQLYPGYVSMELCCRAAMSPLELCMDAPVLKAQCPCSLNSAQYMPTPETPSPPPAPEQ